MAPVDWTSEFPAAITVCDAAGTILQINAKAAEVFASDGGLELIGSNVLDCHPEPARTKTELLLKTRSTNAYTIEKNGIKKLIFQAPWCQGNEYSGFVELSIEIPFELPHFIRS